MTKQEAVKVLARMGAAWPQSNVTEPTQRVWLEHLAPVRYASAAEAIRELEVSCKWFPSISEFAAVVARQAKARSERRDSRPALTEGRASKEVMDRNLREAREAILRAKGKPLAGPLEKAVEEIADAQSA